MTVSTTSNKITYNGDGATTNFAFTFAMPDGTTTQQAAALEVTYVDTTGASTVIAYGSGTLQYQLSVNAAVSPNPTPVGGTVVYNPSGSPIALGTTLTIERVLPETQTVSLQNQGTLWQTVIEQALDYLTMVSQQLQALFGRSITAPATDPDGLIYELPSVADRADQVLGFDSSGNVTVVSTAPAGTISSAMQPVVGAATLALARTAMGLGDLAQFGIGAALQQDGAGKVRVNFFDTSIAGPTTITSIYHLLKLKVTGPVTLTLNRANTYFDGFGFWVENLVGGGDVTIAIDSHDTIENGSSGTSIIIPKGASFFIMTNAASSGTWWIELTLGNRVSAPPAGSYSGLAIKVLTGSAGNNTVSCSARSLVVSDGTYSYTIAPSATINFSTTGANGLDTGTIAINQDYHIWAIYNPIAQTSAWLASLQSTNNATFLSNLPSGYTAYARFGCVKTANATAALYGTWQLDDLARYIAGLGQGKPETTATPGPVASGVVGTYSATSPTLDNTGNRIVVGPGKYVPTTAKSIIVTAQTGWNGSGPQNCNMIVASNSSYSGANNGPLGSNKLVPPIWLSTVDVLSVNAEILLESTQLFVATSGATGVLVCQGWRDNI